MLPGGHTGQVTVLQVGTPHTYVSHGVCRMACVAHGMPWQRNTRSCAQVSDDGCVAISAGDDAKAPSLPSCLACCTPAVTPQCGCARWQVRVWNLLSAELLFELEGHSQPILDLAWAPCQAMCAPRMRLCALSGSVWKASASGHACR